MGKSPKIQITEIFMAKAGKTGWDRRFHGTIRRGNDENGNPIVCSKIKINDGYIYAKADNQWELGEMLDEMCVLVLDYGLHTDSGIYTKILGFQFYSN